MKTKKDIISSLTVVFILIATLLCGLLFGSVNLTLAELIGAINGSDQVASVILFGLRAPRVLAAALAGIGLAVAGTILQTVTDNELCAPHIIGVNSGAGVAVMLLMCVAPTLWRLQAPVAFIGAVGSSFLVLSIALSGSRHNGKSNIILAGVALSALFNAIISFLSLRFPDVLSSYVAFSVGGVAGVSFDELVIPALMILVCFLLSLTLAPKMSLLCLGDEQASSLGVRVRSLRAVAVIVSSALCAAVVSFAGLIGFVGLIVPHITGRLFSGGLRKKIIFGGMSGAILVVVSDLLGRTLFSPGEIPAGIFMALLGGPFFIYLLIGKRKKYDQM